MNNYEYEGQRLAPRISEQSISEEDTRIKTLDAFIKWANNFKEGEFVFRGVPNEAYKIQASAYRRPAENEKDFEKFLHINKDLIRAAKQRGYNKKDGTEWTELDILVNLQHYGAATCLIDFSFSAQVALWFACQPVHKKKGANAEPGDNKKPPNGKVSAVQIKPPKFTEITPEFWEKEDNEEKKKIEFYLKEGKDSPLYYLQPKFQNNRIIAQQSVFLFGQYEFEADNECVIAEECKKDILIQLQRVSGITEDKLFPDFEGFAWVHREESLYTEPTPSALKEQGNRAFENEEYEVAIGDFSRAIDKDSNDAETYNMRGRAYTSLNKYEEALEDFDKAIILKSDYTEAFFHRGIANRSLSQYNEALTDFDEAINLQRDYAEAYYMRGRTKYNLRQYRGAESDFYQATHLDPNYAEAFFYRGISNYNFRRYEEAITDFDESIRLKPDSAVAHCLRGAAKNRLRQYDLAIIDLDESISLDNTFIHSHYERGIAKNNLHQFQEARSDLKIAQTLAEQQNNDDMLHKILDLLRDIDSRTAGGAQDE
jgi:tetratricopeptide (TPR) repeat protein